MRNKLILIAEDEVAYKRILQSTLEKEKFKIISVSNGAELLESLQRLKPDLVLLDLIMPVMDGFGVLKQIRENNEFKDLKVVALSNLGQDDDIKKVQKIGIDGYIIKSDESLSSVVNKVKKYTNSL